MDEQESAYCLLLTFLHLWQFSLFSVYFYFFIRNQLKDRNVQSERRGKTHDTDLRSDMKAQIYHLHQRTQHQVNWSEPSWSNISPERLRFIQLSLQVFFFGISCDKAGTSCLLCLHKGDFFQANIQLEIKKHLQSKASIVSRPLSLSLWPLHRRARKNTSISPAHCTHLIWVNSNTRAAGHDNTSNIYSLSLFSAQLNIRAIKDIGRCSPPVSFDIFSSQQFRFEHHLPARPRGQPLRKDTVITSRWMGTGVV